MRNLKVFIADDHALYRGAVVRMVEAFKRVKYVKEAENGRALFELIRRDIPDVILLDLEMPEWDGNKTFKKLKEQFPEIRVIIVSMHDSNTYISHFLNSGASAFVSKNIEPDELEKAIYKVADKGIYRNKMMNEATGVELRNIGAIVPRKIDLSVQEQKVLQLLCAGLTIKEISHQLEISQYTIRSCKVRLMRKVGIKKVSQLIRFVVQHGLID